MTVKDLQRIVLSESENKTEDSLAMRQLMQRLRDKRFWWIGNTSEHTRRYKFFNGNCCFNHIIGLPKKNGEEKPFFNYQKQIYKALFVPSVYNSRAPTSEEAAKYQRQLVEAELKSQSKKGNIRYAHQEVLDNKTKELIYPFKVKHVWVKKATGLGITELLIRIMCWLSLRNDDYKNGQMVVVTGPNQDLAIKIIKRMKGLFEWFMA